VDAVKLATAATTTLAKHDEEAIYALVNEADARDSPGRPSSKGRLCFSIVGGFGLAIISFGPRKPAFFCINLPVSAMAFLKE
jgi:hypothetical protein